MQIIVLLIANTSNWKFISCRKFRAWRNHKLCQGPSKRQKMARETGLEPATSTVTGWYSNQLSYSPAFAALVTTFFKISPFYRFSNRIQQKIADFQVFCPNRRLLPVGRGRAVSGIYFPLIIGMRLVLPGLPWYVKNSFQVKCKCGRIVPVMWNLRHPERYS